MVNVQSVIHSQVARISKKEKCDSLKDTGSWIRPKCGSVQPTSGFRSKLGNY